MKEFSKLTIQNIEKIQEYLTEKLNGESTITLDMSEVSDVDISFLQLLLSFKNECDSLDKTLNIVKPTDKLLDSLAITGLDQVIDL
jgi:anti-anti-sigma factor